MREPRKRDCATVSGVDNASAAPRFTPAASAAAVAPRSTSIPDAAPRPAFAAPAPTAAPRPLVSIIMPCRNAEAYLRDALERVFRQTYDAWEFIVVDDASTDGTRAVLEHAMERDERVRCLFLDVHAGAGAARNAGLAIAAGAAVWFVDADDSFAEDALESAVDALVGAQADVAVFGCREVLLGADGAIVGECEVLPPAAGAVEGDELHRVVLELEESTLYGYVWNKLYRRECLAGVEFGDAVLVEDILFNIAVFNRAHRVVLVEKSLYSYRRRTGENVTARFVPTYFDEHRLRIQALLDQQVRWGLDSADVRSRLGARYARFIASALERNCDVRARMTHADRVAWCKGLFSDDLFHKLIDASDLEAANYLLSRPLLLFLALLRAHRAVPLLCAGRALHIARHRIAPLYRAITRQKSMMLHG